MNFVLFILQGTTAAVTRKDSGTTLYTAGHTETGLMGHSETFQSALVISVSLCPIACVFKYQVIKLKLSRYMPWRHMGERRYDSYSYLTSALDGGGWSASRPGRALPPGKGPPVPIG
jgi:hypothetical protein